MIRVGIVDSGIDGAARAEVIDCADFGPGGRVAAAKPDESRDAHGHGSRVAEILARCPGVELLDARVFFDTLVTSAAQAAAAIDWLVGRNARVLNLSFGLREDRAVLSEACRRAIDAGVILVAAAPARGDPVYPAAYTGVLRATGDARCARGECSWLAGALADAGGHACWCDGTPAGASAGCAWVSAAVCGLLGGMPDNPSPEALRASMVARARYTGPERKARGPD